VRDGGPARGRSASRPSPSMPGPASA
jgi:hypothetical protein